MLKLRRRSSDCDEVIGESMVNACLSLTRAKSCESIISLSSSCPQENDADCLERNFGDIRKANADGIENVRNVCAAKAFKSMARCIDQGYKYIAVDTEFPGYPLQPDRLGDSEPDKEYAYVAANVNQTKPIQIAFSFFDTYGHSPPGSHTWLFHMRFCLPHRSTYRPQEPVDWETIEFLADHGMCYDSNFFSGVGFGLFYSLLRASDSPLQRKDITWISYHGLKDFAYLLKLSELYQCLPTSRTCFAQKLACNFPKAVDLKYLQAISGNLQKGNLYTLSARLGVCHDNQRYQAGTDARLIGMTYFKALPCWFPGKPRDTFYGHIYGLGNISSPHSPLKYCFKAVREVAPGYPPLPLEYPAVYSAAFLDVKRYFVTRKQNERSNEETLSEAELEYWQQEYGEERPSAIIYQDEC
ncbi:CCR4-NOT transcription complex subunit 7-like [Watersipora subatra]|uniref:CCR4-NOT transcription complex subunit 7-like n=1 Tax=Watersipora subatra TaxID=2589382 RepID=UPI00355BC3E4